MEFVYDLPYLLRWYAVLTLIGLIFLPFSGVLFRDFLDRGYAFSRIVGIVCISLTIWTLSYLHILPFSFYSVFGVTLVFLGINIAIGGLSWKKKKKTLAFSFDSRRALDAFMPSSTSHTTRSLIIIEEILFITIILLYAWIRGHEPSIHGLEKFMDYGFINSILVNQYLPAQDMWLAPTNKLLDDGLYTQGFYINYYYFGHFTTAVLTLFSGIRTAVTYNLMLISTFGLSALGAFGLGSTMIGLSLQKYDEFRALHQHDQESLGERTRGYISRFFSALKEGFTLRNGNQNTQKVQKTSMFLYPAAIGGLLSAFLVTIAGNLHTIYIFTKGYDGENPVPFWQIFRSFQELFLLQPTYWYPNATRFIPNTIHEFPSYSWVVADLHGHVLDIPFVLLTLGLLFSYILTKLQGTKTQPKNKPQLVSMKFVVWSVKFVWNLLVVNWHIILLGIMTGVMYMTNAWDGLIYLGLTSVVISVVHAMCFLKDQKASYLHYIAQTAVVFGALIIMFILTTFTFSLSFQPFASQIGVVGGWELLIFLNVIDSSANTYALGPLLFEEGNNLRSPIWMLGVLWGFFLFFVLSFGVYLINLYKTTSSFAKLGPSPKKGFMLQTFNIVNIFVLTISIVSIGLIIFPEFFYAKDIYPGHYRANTMFKLGYQAYIMFSLASAYTIMMIVKVKKFSIKGVNLYQVWKALSIILLVMVFLYPYYAFDSYYIISPIRHTNPNPYKGLDGVSWLATSYPDDYTAIVWMNTDSGILDRKSDIRLVEAVGDSYTDYARFSVHTGLSTVLGWPVHEWLWRGSYDEPSRRIEDVKAIYESKDEIQVKSLLDKYEVTHIVIGQLERDKYPALNETIIAELAFPAFSSGGTTVWEVR